MKKIVIAGLLISTFLFTGCSNDKEVTADNSRFKATGEKFEIVSNGTNNREHIITVIEDTETGILYLWDNDFINRGGLTPWLDSEGKPMKK